MLKRKDGARFEATIKTTSDGPQAAYVVSLQADDHTLTETDVQLFANKEAAEAWLNSAAILRGFISFSTEFKE
jgi:hypothetical protein